MRAGEYLEAVRALPVGRLEDIAPPGALLVLAPHQDDESLGCGGLIAAAIQAGRRVHVVFVTDGSASHSGSLRYPPRSLAGLRANEAREALAVLGVPPSQVTFLDLPDSRAPSEGPAFEAAARQIVAVGRRIAPTAIFATWRWEPHGDHRATWHLADRASESLECGVYGYLIWAWQLPPDSDLPEPRPSGWRLDIRAHQAVKRAAIACHRSQTTGLIDDAETCFQLTDEMIAELTRPYECFVRGGSRPPDY